MEQTEQNIEQSDNFDEEIKTAANIAVNRLTDDQREQVIDWLLVGYSSYEISRMATEEGFQISPQVVNNYYKPKLIMLYHNKKYKLPMVSKEERIARLVRLAQKLEELIYGSQGKSPKLILKKTKTFEKNGSCTTDEEEQYNEGLVRNYLNTISDIAAECGGRKQMKEVKIDKTTQVDFISRISVIREKKELEQKRIDEENQKRLEASREVIDGEMGDNGTGIDEESVE